jgi:uncharacterized protein involved in exopolysaccharide biosynthesis
MKHEEVERSPEHPVAAAAAGCQVLLLLLPHGRPVQQQGGSSILQQVAEKILQVRVLLLDMKQEAGSTHQAVGQEQTAEEALGCRCSPL